MRLSAPLLAALLSLAALATTSADLSARPGGRRARAGASASAALSHSSSRTLLAAASAASAASTSDRLAWMWDYASTAAWATSAPQNQDVSVVLMTSHFFGAYAQVSTCGPVKGAKPGSPGSWNLTCDFNEDRGRAEAADALW